MIETNNITPEKQKSSKTVLIIVLVLVLLAALAMIWPSFKPTSNKKVEEQTVKSAPTVPNEIVNSKTPAENFASYQASLKGVGWTITQAIEDSKTGTKYISATDGTKKVEFIIEAQGTGSKITIKTY